ncbi:MAG: hypothetical protein PHT19_07350 [Methylococcus sp.]|nr:hypothetical protein [Methylococcus sp.]
MLSNQSKVGWYVWLLLTGISLALHFLTGELILTGDEVRYLFAGVSIWLSGDLALPSQAWTDWQLGHGLSGNIPSGSGIHSVVHMGILSPLVAFLGLPGGRYASLLFCGFASTYFVVNYQYGKGRDVFVWTLLYLASMPLLAYMSLLYAEIWLASFLFIVMAKLSKKQLSVIEIYLVAALIMAMPFIHIRASLVALLCFVYLLAFASSNPGWLIKHYIVLLASALFSLVLFGAYQKIIAGGLTAAATFSPAFDIFIDRLAVQLFSYRHGLLLYSPIALCGFAGLIVGMVRRDRFVIFLLLCLLLYVVSFVWGTASESYTARFWVFVTPILIAGSIYWWRSSFGILRWLIVLPLVSWTLINTILFEFQSHSFLENRFGSVSWDAIYYYTGKWFHPGLIAITDPFDAPFTSQPEYPSPQNVVYFIFMIVMAMVLVGVGGSLARLSGMSVLLMYLYVGASCVINEYDPALYVKTIQKDDRGNSVVSFNLSNPLCVSGFKVGRYADAPLWGVQKQYPKSFVITAIDYAGNSIGPLVVPGLQLLRIPINDRKLRQINIASHDDQSDSGWAEFDIRLF